MSIRGRSSNSLEVEVKVDELIGILQSNRQIHQEAYRAQVAGWNVALTASLQNILSVLAASENVAEFGEPDPSRIEKLKNELYRLPTPVSNEVDYDRTIGMLEMHQRAGKTTIILEAMDYARYVDDDWEWKDAFLSTSATYAVSSGRR